MKCVPVHHGIPAVLHRDVPWLHRHSENGAFEFSNKPSTTIIGPSPARQRNVSWRANDDPTLNADLVALCFFFKGPGPVLLRNPIFCDFSGGGGGPVPPSGSAHVHIFLNKHFICKYKSVVFFSFHLTTIHMS